MAYRPTIEVFEDPDASEGGQALIRVNGLPRRPADAEFTIRRFGYDKGVLGPDGWQGPDARLQPQAASFDNGTLEITVGPEVVDEIDVGTPVEIELPGAGIRDNLTWPTIAPSVHGSHSEGRTRFAFTRRAPPAGAAEQETVLPEAPPPPPPPPPADEDAPTVFQPRPPADYGRDESFDPMPDLGGVPGHDEEPTAYSRPRDWDEPDDEDEPTAAFDDDDDRSGFPWGILVGILLFLLLIAAGGAYWFFHEELGLPWPFAAEETEDPQPEPDPDPRPEPEPDPRPEPEPDPRPEPEPEPRPEPEPQPQPEPEPVDRLPERDARTPPFDFARTLLASDPSPERMFEMAMEYLDRGEADVALLLLEQAEARAHPPAMRAIGRLYDPVHFDPRDSPFTHANPDRALDYYRRALDAGDAEARAAIDRLESWAEAAAAEGDPEAEALLDRLRP